MKRSLTAGISIVCLAAVGAVHADGLPAQVGVFVGANHYGTDSELGNSPFADQVPGLGALFGLRTGLLQRHERLAVEGEVAVAATTTDGDPAMGRPSANASLVAWRAQLLYQLAPERALHPFVSLAAGGVTFLMDAPASFPVDSPDTDYDIKLGVGGKYRFGRRYGARADLRVGLVPNRDSAVGLAYEGHAGVYVAFDLTGLFGRRAVAAQAPVDADGDGLIGEADRCPGQAEVFNSIDDDDGCPEVDSDGDGLLGSRDQCPDEAEDVDGFEDDDGCRDPDNDRDGRPDAIDQCALAAETLNGFEDDDGCPDELPPKVAEFTGTIEGIVFELNSARIDPASSEVLLRAVAVLAEYPSLRIEISGHTDDQGSAQVNTDLSRERAVRVKWFLVDRGIEAARIVTVGYGPARPRASNDTAEGRAQNRRIEFRLLPGAAQLAAP